MATLNLASLEETEKLGAWLAANASCLSNILMTGDLGCGKTALARAIVGNLPGAAETEFSSPSFTICNWYPTTPPVCHCDLYRCQSSVPDEVISAMEDMNTLAIVEWANFLPDSQLPADRLDISISVSDNARRITIEAHGESSLVLEKLPPMNS